MDSGSPARSPARHLVYSLACSHIPSRRHSNAASACYAVELFFYLFFCSHLSFNVTHNQMQTLPFIKLEMRALKATCLSRAAHEPHLLTAAHTHGSYARQPPFTRTATTIHTHGNHPSHLLHLEPTIDSFVTHRLCTCLPTHTLLTTHTHRTNSELPNTCTTPMTNTDRMYRSNLSYWPLASFPRDTCMHHTSRHHATVQHFPSTQHCI